MRVGIDTLSVIPGRVAGGTTYLVNLIQQLAEIDDNNQYVLFLSPANTDVFKTNKPNFERVILPVNTKNKPARVLWEQVVLPILFFVKRIDLMFFPGNIMSLLTSCKTVLTVHDLSTLYYLKNFPTYAKEGHLSYAKILKQLSKYSVRKASGVITISEFSKSEILHHFNVQQNRITVIYLGRAIPKRESVSKDQESLIMSRYGISVPYILYVGVLAKHKNLERLVKAFAILKRKNQLDYQLVLVGGKGSATNDIGRTIKNEGMNSEVILTEFVPVEDLHVLYRNASLFVFPSLYEGFGLPLIEAMSHGVPIVCSSAGPLSEVAGNAAIFFDPLDVNNMAHAIERVLKDLDLKNKLIKRGYERVKNFSWENTARKTLAVFEEVYRGK